jgi:malate dehydrogenase
VQRVGIIGVGNIGSTLTHMLLQQKFGCHIGVYDINTDVLQGKIWDLEEASVIGDYEGKIEILPSIEAFNTYDVVVITAGRARTPGMDRKDLLKENAHILQDVSQKLQNFSGIIIVVTNPVDLMVRFLQDQMPHLPCARIVGMAGVLDEGRMAARIKDQTGIHRASQLGVCVVGPHSDHMIPLAHVKLGPGTLDDLVPLTETQSKQIIQDTRNGGARIVSKLKTGSAFYAPAAACLRMIQTVLGFRHEVLTCSVRFSEKGPFKNRWSDVYFGWPVILSPQGVMAWAMPCMTHEETETLHVALQQLRQDYQEFREHMR